MVYFFLTRGDKLPFCLCIIMVTKRVCVSMLSVFLIDKSGHSDHVGTFRHILACVHVLQEKVKIK